MDAASFREKAAFCLRIARELSWNNPGRLELLELAERLEQQAKEFELKNHQRWHKSPMDGGADENFSSRNAVGA